MVNSALPPQPYFPRAGTQSQYLQTSTNRAPITGSPVNGAPLNGAPLNPTHTYRTHPAAPAPRLTPPTAQEETSRPFPAGLLFKLTGSLCVCAIVLYLLAQVFGEQISRGGHEASDRLLEVVIANSVLNIPANTVRFSSQRSNSSQKRLEMYLHWPTLSGYSDDLKDHFSLVGSQESLIFITLEPRNMSLEMSGRIKPIYSKFLEGEPQRTRFGLTRHALSPEGGFIDEDLYYEADKQHPFAARCIRKASTVGSPICIRDFHIGNDLMLTYRFHIQHIGHWKQIDRSLKQMIEGMIIN